MRNHFFLFKGYTVFLLNINDVCAIYRQVKFVSINNAVKINDENI